MRAVALWPLWPLLIPPGVLGGSLFCPQCRRCLTCSSVLHIRPSDLGLLCVPDLAVERKPPIHPFIHSYDSLIITINTHPHFEEVVAVTDQH